MLNEEIARRIKEVRKERGMTQKDIAEFLNKTAATVSDIERGKIQVSAADLFTLAQALNKPIEYFFGEEYDSEEIQDLIAVIRKQSPEQQEKIIQQTKMFISLQMFLDRANATGEEVSDDEIKNAVNYIFSYADEIEAIYHQVMEIKTTLREVFKAQGIDEKEIIKDTN